jgi:hypothetical protein
MDEFFDSEDPHPITADENPYPFDSFPTPRATQSRKAVTSKQAPAPNKRRADGAVTSSPRKNTQKIDLFTQTLHEIGPLIHLSLQHSDGEIDVAAHEEGLGVLLKSHQNLLSEVCDRIGLSQEDIGDKYLVSALAVRISKIVYGLKSLPSNVIYASVGTAIGVLDGWISENSNLIRELILREKHRSADVLVNVKLALFSPTIRLYGLFEKWRVGPWRDKHASWMMDLSVDFAKDISFNWDKRANFKEKQDLFQGVLEMCADLVIDTYEEYVRLTIKQTVEEEYSFEHDGLKRFSQAFDQMDVGYKDHEVINQTWLVNKVRMKKEAMLLHYSPVSLLDNENYFVEKLLVIKIDDLIAQAWVSATKAFFSKVASMSEEERDVFLASEEASKPMPFDLFEEELEKIRPRQFDIVSQNINLQEVAQKSRKLLAEMWGISDAFCKISRV